ncbi:hypothetical protein BH160DRAFT_1864 [Burkholderia sp. H160]|nr:hypothetical protein BH160DRAFT_1864 [Burkholderia sp. H160]
MGPKTPVSEGDLFRHPLRERINMKLPLVRLADLINWDGLNASMSASFVSRKGRPATLPRLIAGLLYLQHAFDLSDEEVVWQWVENPYWQVFTGETFLQTEPLIDASSLTRWRKRLGEAGVEELLAETIEAAKGAGVIKASSVKRVIVDTTVMEKAIAHQTDSRLLERCREHLVNAAVRQGLKLRRNYNHEAPRLGLQIGRYAHAKQYKRMRKVSSSATHLDCLWRAWEYRVHLTNKRTRDHYRRRSAADASTSSALHRGIQGPGCRRLPGNRCVRCRRRARTSAQREPLATLA